MKYHVETEKQRKPKSLPKKIIKKGWNYEEWNKYVPDGKYVCLGRHIVNFQGIFSTRLAMPNVRYPKIAWHT